MAKKFFSMVLITSAIVGALFMIGKASLAAKLASPEIALLTESIPETSPSLKENETINLLKNTITKLSEEAQKNVSQDIDSTIPKIDPEKFAESILNEGSLDFDPESLRVTVSVEDLVITPSKDKTAIESYFKGIQAILQKANNDVYVFTKNDPSPASFKQIATLIDGAATHLQEIPVPAPAAHLHAREISLMKTQVNTFKILSETDKDPVRALFAFQMLESLKIEFDEVGDEFLKLLNEYDITY